MVAISRWRGIRPVVMVVMFVPTAIIIIATVTTTTVRIYLVQARWSVAIIAWRLVSIVTLYQRSDIMRCPPEDMVPVAEAGSWWWNYRDYIPHSAGLRIAADNPGAAHTGSRCWVGARTDLDCSCHPLRR